MDVCAGLCYIHENGMVSRAIRLIELINNNVLLQVHGDLKAVGLSHLLRSWFERRLSDIFKANVVVSSHGVAMITDFGNAQLRDVTLKFSNTTSRSAISARWAVWSHIT